MMLKRGGSAATGVALLLAVTLSRNVATAYTPSAVLTSFGTKSGHIRASVSVRRLSLLKATSIKSLRQNFQHDETHHINSESLSINSRVKPSGLKRPIDYKKFFVRTVLSLSIIALASSSVVPRSAIAATKKAAVSTIEHMHTGQKIANYIRSFGVPDVLVLAVISALPVVELRGAVPVGIWMGLPMTTVLIACVLGNMAPIVPLMFLLKSKKVQKIMSPVLKRAEKKSAGLGVGSLEKQWASLAAFVGIPLPGTGAWTGAMGAFLLGMPMAAALSSIFAGVVAAGAIVTALTLSGAKGGLIALAGLALITGTEFIFGGKEKKQDFLEASPYWDQSTVPLNVYKNKAPFVGKVISTKRIVGPKATGETCHIVIDHKGVFPYWEGQSWGVIPPGVREKDGKPHSVRLYSIASSRYGDDMTGETGSLCVRRATYWCPELKADDPAKKGICSNFLCDTKAGDEVVMTGPAGKVMLLPEEDPNTDYIMVATGTGIAPYRGFIRRLFVENTPAARAYKGQAWLFLGVANSDALLYDDEWQDVKAKYPDQFFLDYAISREQTNTKGGKMYVQDKVEEYSNEIFSRLDNGAHIYFCGLKGMMPGIQDMLKSVAEKKGLNYDEWLKGLKDKKQWHVEVY